jgi:conjugal transfer pilus assembly protein TraB
MSENKPLFVRKGASPSAAVPSAKALTGKKDVKKRLMVSGLVLVGATVAFSSMMADNPAPKAAATKPGSTEKGIVVESNPTSSRQDNEEFGRKVTAELNTLKAQIGELNTKNEALQQKLNQAEKTAAPVSTPNGIVTPPVKGGSAPSTTATPPAPPVPPVSISGGTGSLPGSTAVSPISGPVGGTGANAAPVAAPVLTTPAATPKATGPRAPQSYDVSGASSSSTTETSVAALGGLPGSGPVKSKVNYVKNAHYGEISMGAFAPVVLLNGVEAGTSTTSRADPQPILMTLVDHAILPGNASYSLKSCFAMGTAQGNASTERAEIRIDQISCTDKQNKLVLNQKVSAYLVDSDGYIGIRGKYVEKQGAKLSRALLAGFAQGLTSALGTAQSASASSITSTGSTSSTTINAGAVLRSSAFQGSSTAIGQLADFYMKEATSLFPVISVANGRTATLVFSAPSVLEWAPAGSKYSAEVAPNVNSGK